MTDKIHHGHTFHPSLQNISLKRFRLRYCCYDDCYYMHWDDTVCPQLAKIYGFKNGVFSCKNTQRYVDEGTGESYLSCEEDAESASIEWRIDFSSCGLVIMNAQIKMASVPSENGDQAPGLEFLVRGDNILLSPQLGRDRTEFPELSGCSKLSIIADMTCPYRNSALQFLPGSGLMAAPMDIIIDLMCPRPREEIYCGEILLGIKFRHDSHHVGMDLPECTQDGIIMDCHPTEGQLQVHVVEGARLVDEETNKPYKTVVKCNLVPDTGRFGTKQTTPRHNAYPTWTENFIFNGVTKEELVNGGLEVILYDHHHFSGDHTIGGLRMCVPLRKEHRYIGLSPSLDNLSLGQSRSTSPNSHSPVSIPTSHSPSPTSHSPSPASHSPSPASHSPSPTLNETSLDFHSDLESRIAMTRKEKTKSLPSIQPFSVVLRHSPHSPHILKRSISPGPGLMSPNTLSPCNLRRSQPDLNKHSPSSTSTSPKSSPMSIAKTFFRLSGSHIKSSLSPNTSPRSSPRLRRKRGSDEDRASVFVRSWMENVTAGETNHWSQVLEKEGEWVYFWHSIRYKLKAV